MLIVRKITPVPEDNLKQVQQVNYGYGVHTSSHCDSYSQPFGFELHLLILW